MPWKADAEAICASISPVLHLYFIGYKKYFMLLFTRAE